MSDPWHPEGIYQCEGCGKVYPEYVNGCVEEHERPRRVALVVAEEPAVTMQGIEEFVNDVAIAFIRTLETLGDAIGEAFYAIKNAVSSLFDFIEPLMEVFCLRYAVEHMGITEADIKRIDMERRQVVCWNWKRYDLPEPQIMMEKMK